MKTTIFISEYDAPELIVNKIYRMFDMVKTQKEFNAIFYYLLQYGQSTNEIEQYITNYMSFLNKFL
mgnify:FL=1